MTTADEIKKLAELHRAGAISDEEFAAAKARLLAPTPPMRVTPLLKPATSPTRSSNVRAGCLSLIVLVLVGFVLIVALSGGNGSTTTTTVAGLETTSAPPLTCF